VLDIAKASRPEVDEATLSAIADLYAEALRGDDEALFVLGRASLQEARRDTLFCHSIQQGGRAAMEAVAVVDYNRHATNEAYRGNSTDWLMDGLFLYARAYPAYAEWLASIPEGTTSKGLEIIPIEHIKLTRYGEIASLLEKWSRYRPRKLSTDFTTRFLSLTAEERRRFFDKLNNFPSELAPCRPLRN
jgi:hypothetical protein